MASKQLNRVRVTTSTTGTGDPILLGAATSDKFFDMDEAGAEDGAEYRYIVFQSGNDDFMIVSGVYDVGSGEITRATIHGSKIGGTAGTDDLDLVSGAVVRIVASKEDFDEILAAIDEANSNAIVMAAALGG